MIRHIAGPILMALYAKSREYGEEKFILNNYKSLGS
jgi:hypothetical protein